MTLRAAGIALVASSLAWHLPWLLVAAAAALLIIDAVVLMGRRW